MEKYAKKSFLAILNPYQTVEKAYPGVIDRVRIAIEKSGYAYYTGYKKTKSIPETLIARMEKQGFLRHTEDRMSLGGRAVDMKLVNPLSGNWMTGSSSGTALNVFYGINDLGIGTDGGGSVLAPAASLNLYGFISPLIEEKFLEQFRKTSTDGITFSPSIGLITRNLETLKKAVACALDTQLSSKAVQSVHSIKVAEKIDIYGKREPLIAYVRGIVKKGTILISEEGPVDLLGLGDTIFGHFSEETESIQRKSGKGLMRVANMCRVSAIVIPGCGLGRCTLILCDSNLQDIGAILTEAEKYIVPQSELVKRYFENYSMYFEG